MKKVMKSPRKASKAKSTSSAKPAKPHCLTIYPDMVKNKANTNYKILSPAFGWKVTCDGKKLSLIPSLSAQRCRYCPEKRLDYNLADPAKNKNGKRPKIVIGKAGGIVITAMTDTICVGGKRIYCESDKDFKALSEMLRPWAEYAPLPFKTQAAYNHWQLVKLSRRGR